MARRCEWKILQCHQKGLFLSFGDVATGPDQGKYLMAPNAARKLQRIQVECLTVSVFAFVVTVELIALRGKMTDVARQE